MSQALDEQFAKLSKKEQQLFHIRHTAEHVLHTAMQELYPELKKAMGPATKDGFYFDFDLAEKLSDADFERIEQRMSEIIKADLPMKQRYVDAEEAKEIFKDNPYKLDWLEQIGSRGEKISLFAMGDRDEDLCSGPHAESTGAVKAFKLLSIAGAYWHGDEKNKMLTRIYGTAFGHKKELKVFLQQLEEAKLRDHRKLGKDLNLFFIDDMVGKGLVMWLPNGTVVRDQIELFAKETERKANYKRVSTPHIAKKELFLTSGHLPYYEEDMYPGMEMDDGTYYLKGMNCPHHHRIYKHQPKSYKEFPIRLAEYGMCYRNELSGTLAGLLRVRGLCMNDAHIYCRKDQIESEFKNVINMTLDYLSVFGLEDYWFRLSKWDPNHTDKYINEPENWELTQEILRKVLTDMKLNFVEADDEAAFYGPKVDVQFKSVIGREETMSTIQLDFLAKERFGLSYTDEQGQENGEVFVIHRAPLSVHERFMAFVIEHFAGAFPTWLAPLQVKVLPITDNELDYAQKIRDQLFNQHIRVEVDARSERLQAKIRDAQMEKIPYMLILGKQEVEQETISVRTRNGKNLQGLKFDSFVSAIKEEIANKSLDLMEKVG